MVKIKPHFPKGYGKNEVWICDAYKIYSTFAHYKGNFKLLYHFWIAGQTRDYNIMKWMDSTVYHGTTALRFLCVKWGISDHAVSVCHQSYYRLNSVNKEMCFRVTIQYGRKRCPRYAATSFRGEKRILNNV